MNQPWSDYDSDWFIGLNSSATNIVVAILMNQLNKRETVNISEAQSSSPTGPGKKRIPSDTHASRHRRTDLVEIQGNALNLRGSDNIVRQSL